MDRSKEIRDFAHDAYDYIWSQQTFLTKGVKEKFAECYSLRCSLTDETKTTNFTEGVGKAVRITQFLLRDYFDNFFQFTKPDKSFKKDVKLMWSHWLDNRANIFVKVIDTMAIIAESFLFSDGYKKLLCELNEMTEWFIEWFEEHLASEFFKRGGWKKLNNLAFEWYDDLFENVKECVDLSYYTGHSESVNTIYSCSLVDYLKQSPVKFPIPERALFGNSKFRSDKSLCRRTVYVRLSCEFDTLESNSYHKCLPVEIQDEVKCEDMKPEQLPTKLEHKEELNTEISPSIVKKIQFDEIRNNCNAQNPKDASIVQSPSQFPIISKVSTKQDGGIYVDLKSSIGDISTDEVNTNLTQLQTTSDFQFRLPSIEELTKNGNLKNNQSREILKETSEHIEFDTLAEDHSEKQFHQIEQSDNEEAKESKPTPDVKLDSIALKNTKLNFTQELIPKQTENASECTEKSIKSAISSEDFAATLSSPESSANLEQTLVTEHTFPTKEVLKISQSAEETKNNEVPNPPLNTKNCSYEQFIQTLLQSALKEDFQIEGSQNQNKFYLISDLFSNSFVKLFEAYKTNTLAERLQPLNISECLIPTVPEDKKSEQQSNIPFDLLSLKFEFKEYRFYFEGEEHTFKTSKKSKRRRSQK